MNKRVKFLLFLVFVFFIFSQLTRFENEAIIVYDGVNITAEIHQINVSIPVGNVQFHNVSAYFSKHSTSESALQLLEIYDENGRKVYSLNKFSIFLFGKDLLHTAITGQYPGWTRSFGDWSRDGQRSQEVFLYANTLPSNFKIHARFIGRGGNAIVLTGQKYISIGLADGFLSNVVSICTDFSGCSVSVPTVFSERKLINLKRIANFFFEGLFLASLIGLLGLILCNGKKVNL